MPAQAIFDQGPNGASNPSAPQGLAQPTPQVIAPTAPDEPTKKPLKGRLVTVVVVAAIFLLAGISIFTATRLYRLRGQAVAPTAPESKPLAQEIPQASPSLPTSAPLLAQASPTPSPSPSPTASPTPTPTLSPTPTPSPTQAPTPSPSTELPAAGMSLVTIAASGVGVLLFLISLLLAVS